MRGVFIILASIFICLVLFYYLFVSKTDLGKEVQSSFVNESQILKPKLYKLMQILNKLPHSNPDSVRNYFILEDGELFINNTFSGYGDSVNNTGMEILSKFPPNEISIFKNLTLQLKQQYGINSSYFDESVDEWLFSYKTGDSPSFKNSFFIVYKENQNDTNLIMLNSEYIILDKKNNLLLIRNYESDSAYLERIHSISK